MRDGDTLLVLLVGDVARLVDGLGDMDLPLVFALPFVPVGGRDLLSDLRSLLFVRFSSLIVMFSPLLVRFSLLIVRLSVLFVRFSSLIVRFSLLTARAITMPIVWFSTWIVRFSWLVDRFSTWIVRYSSLIACRSSVSLVVLFGLVVFLVLLVPPRTWSACPAPPVATPETAPLAAKAGPGYAPGAQSSAP